MLSFPQVNKSCKISFRTKVSYVLPLSGPKFLVPSCNTLTSVTTCQILGPKIKPDLASGVLESGEEGA